MPRFFATRRIPIGQGDPMGSLMLRGREAGADLVVEAVRGFREGTVEVHQNPAGGGACYSFPRREDIARTQARGLRLR